MQFSALAVVLLLVLARAFGNLPQHRPARRSSVRAALANKMDPNFWPTRGRRSSSSLLHQNAVRQTTDPEGPFWANRGRSISELETLLGMAARQTEANDRQSIEYPETFWDLESSNGVSALNEALTSGEEGPFWANRGRSIGNPIKNLHRDVLYAEEPRWISVPERSIRRSMPSNTDADTFWVARGKRLSSAGQVQQQELNKSTPDPLVNY